MLEIMERHLMTLAKDLYEENHNIPILSNATFTGKMPKAANILVIHFISR